MSNRGFTLLELSVSMGIVSVLISGAVFLVSLEVDSARQSDTIAKVLLLKRAIVGDPRIVTKESRTDFGYVGDMGSLPNSLQDLWIRGAQPAYSYDNAKKAGAGWAGPYIQLGPLEFVDDITKDSWGNLIQYVVGTGTSSATGQQYRAKIFSFGPNAAPGDSDDITAEIYTTDMLSTVVSYVRDSAGNPMSNVGVKINYPSAGVLTSSSTFSSATGAYSFSDIPIGSRSVTVEPKLAYSEGSAVSTTAGGGTNVEFVVLSFSCGTLTYAAATYDAVAFYQRLWIGKDKVFDNATNLAASGEQVNFSTAVDVSGSGCSGGGTGIKQVFPVRIQSAFTQVPDQDIGTGASAAPSIRIRMENFKSLEGGGGANVDMTGISITMTFSDGSSATFTPVPK